eukprot:TRINITY_DN369_c0_g1_i1.p1 TRINITY_DN369_c0_g1~~TRINITY_DN369_c0_g1_i1.p1  ORF type:complete len:158 (+),score=33.34 TRINITY_DN369_c0_g1_i1:23-475(+)
MAPLPLTPAVAAVLNVRRNSFSSSRDRYSNVANYLSNSPVDATWGSPTGKPDWGMEKLDMDGRHRRSSSLIDNRLHNGPDQDKYRILSDGDFAFSNSNAEMADIAKGFIRMEQQHDANHVRLPREASIDSAMIGSWIESHQQQLNAEKLN